MRYWIFVILNKLVRKIGGRGLSRIPGLLNVYKFVYQKTKPKNPVLVNAQGYKIYMNPNDKIIFPELIIEGVWEEFETQLFRELLAPGMVVVDVGANFGYYTLIRCLSPKVWPYSLGARLSTSIMQSFTR